MTIVQTTFKNISMCFNNKDEKDFFCDLFQNRFSKILAIIFATVSAPFIILALWGIIWYERYGHDTQRTIINKLYSSLCWVGIEFIILVIFPDTVRYTLGPFPSFLCWKVFTLKPR
jgi:hypothetical protein